ncbi:MAG: anaerobic ribonucleoside-triphosphate reductase activating protein [Candidatus Tantalella remota]|nr:anaerobic ribonucleoside-triphosphate reductase activating protein [Candidatus Tantalella remota]
MVIAGLQNLSLVDYPGCLASTVFLQGCNFRCGYCHNPDLISMGKNFEFTEKEFFDFADQRKNFIEGVVISGGEPTLYEEIPEFIKRIKDLGFKVKLDTNGSNPEQLDMLLRERLLDMVAIDIKTSFERYSLVTDDENIQTKVTRSIYLAMLSTVPYEFRTTCAPGIVSEEDIRKIAETVNGAENYCLQQFHPRSTYDTDFQEVTPYEGETIKKFKSILEEHVKEVTIRGV